MNFHLDTHTINSLPRVERRAAFRAHRSGWAALLRASAVNHLGFAGGVDAVTFGRLLEIADDDGRVDLDDALRVVRSNRTQQAHAETQPFSYGSVGRWRGAVMDASLQTSDVEQIRELAARHGVKPTREAVSIIVGGVKPLDVPGRPDVVAGAEVLVDSAESLISAIEDRLGRVLTESQRAAIEFVFHNDGVEGAGAAVRQTLSRLRRS